jgi:hypothetical protein
MHTHKNMVDQLDETRKALEAAKEEAKKDKEMHLQLQVRTHVCMYVRTE